MAQQKDISEWNACDVLMDLVSRVHLVGTFGVRVESRGQEIATSCLIGLQTVCSQYVSGTVSAVARAGLFDVTITTLITYLVTEIRVKDFCSDYDNDGRLIDSSR